MKTALITGGTKGIGRMVTLNLIRNNYYTIVVYSSDQQAADELYKELTENEKQLISLVILDLSIETNIELLIQKVNNLVGLDVLILNAGKTNRKSFEEISFQEWLEVFNFNCTIPLFIIQKLLPKMNKDASVIFTGSLMAIYPHSVSLSYGVSKSAVHAIVKNLVKFLSPYSIRINVIVPGFTNTDWHTQKSPDMIDNITKRISLQRFAETEEVASAFMFVINNKYINGQEIVLDGGYLYQ